MARFLITGGAGFFGSILKKSLVEDGHCCVSIDLLFDAYAHPRCVCVQGDIRDKKTIDALFSRWRFDATFHCAAILAHAVSDKQFLWTCNVDGTRVLLESAIAHHVPKIIFTSSNCLWGKGMNKPVTEEEPPAPVEIYGRSKWEGEKILLSHRDQIEVIIFRCPTIIDAGRLGLLSILFEFVDEGRKIWVVGNGRNAYQFVYAGDLIDACVRAAKYHGSNLFNIGSDNVSSFREVYQSLAIRADTGARLASLPRWPTLLAMRVAHALRLSPLGPYQYKMIAESFQFDTTKIKEELSWHPTMTNEEMLWEAYCFYRDHRPTLAVSSDVSAHRQPARMGVIRLLKWFS